MKPAKQLAKKVFQTLGLEVSRYRPKTTEERPLGVDYLSDIRKLTRSNPCIVMDVGANIGQSVNTYKELLPHCEIHSFEPGPATFEVLKKNVSSHSNVHVNNLAVGSLSGKKTFLENSYPNMSSFLRPDEYCWGEIVAENEVEVTTLDRYCEEKGIQHVSLLKTDTQGYEFEVLKGAAELLRSNRIEMIFMEVIFSAMYKDLPTFDEVYRFLLDRNFKLVAFYQFYYQQDTASWSDALFINPSFDYGKSADNVQPVHSQTVTLTS